MSSDNYEYDVFISYSSKHKAWVRGHLLTQLEASGLTVCIDFRDFRIGAPSIEEMQRAVLESRKMLAVLTPNYMQSGWTNFEMLMQRTLDLAEQKERYIPLLKEFCEIPISIGYLTYANFVDPDDLALEWTRLLTALDAPNAAPPPLQPPCPVDNPFTDVGRINDPARFFPRPRTLREIQQTLAAGNSVSLVGESQIGKSSLLYYLYKTQTVWHPEFKVAYLDMQKVFGEDVFVEDVLEMMGRTGSDLRTLRRVLRNESLLLLMDEVEKLALKDFSNHLLDLLRAMIQDGNLKLVVASRRPLTEVFPDDGLTSDWYNVFTVQPLGPLSEKQVNAFLDARLGLHASLFTPEERQNLYQETNGHPARVQRAAQALFMQKVNRS